MASNRKVWVYSRSALAKNQPAVPESLKTEVTTKTSELITYLKLQHIEEPPENPQFINYITDIYAEWWRNSFYFCAHYCSQSPDAIEQGFENKFARMQYVGNGHFDLSYMRHTGKWELLFPGQTVDECLELIKTDSFFHP